MLCSYPYTVSGKFTVSPIRLSVYLAMEDGGVSLLCSSYFNGDTTQVIIEKHVVVEYDSGTLIDKDWVSHFLSSL